MRCIDDFSRSSVNSAVQTFESRKPHTANVFAAMCVQAMSQLRTNESWLGRTFDLVGANRQCATKPSSQQFAYIVVQEPGSAKLFAFRMRALPFGSIRSVHAFLRVSHRLWYILVKEFMLLTTKYFGDFVSISTAIEASAVQVCMHMFFKMLGWFFAESGDKAPDFAPVFQALGVNVNVSSMGGGLVTIGNAETQRQELIKFIDEVLRSRRLSKAEALRLRGRLQFVSGNVFGRIAKSALQRSRLMHISALLHNLMKELAWPFQCIGTSWLTGVLENVALLVVMSGSSDRRLGDHIFSGIGAVLAGKPVRFFSEKLTPQLLLDVNPPRKKTAIFECEFFALLCSIVVWSDLMSGSAVFYTDNNAVRDCLKSCNAGNAVAKRILIAVLALECTKQITRWYARVPTDSTCLTVHPGSTLTG